MPELPKSLDAYLDIAEVIILVLDRNACIRRINRKGVEILGFQSAAELEGRSWFDTAILPQQRDEMEAVFWAVVSGEEDWPQQYENQVLTTSGQTRLIEWRNTMLRDADGRITGSLSSGTDVTERRAVEKELRQVEQRQRYLLDLESRLRDAPNARAAVHAACHALGEELGASFVGVGEVQPDQEHTIVESEWRRTSDIPSTIGRHHQPSTGPERFAAMMRGEVVVVTDVLEDSRTSAQDARKAYAAFRARSSLDVPLTRAGKLRAVLFMAAEQPRDWSTHDIRIAQETLDRTWHAVERARAEAELVASESRLRDILNALPIGVVLGEAPSGKLTFANRATEDIFRHPPLPSPDVESYREWEGYHADGRRVEGGEYPLARVLNTGQPAEGNYHYRRGDGTMSWLRITGAPIRDEHDRMVAGVVGVIDIDEQISLLEHQRVLVAELSHRVKNVLAVVQAIATQSLKRAHSLDDFRVTFEGRLQALAAAHSLLVRSNWSTLLLSDLVEVILKPFANHAGTVHVAGEEVRLNARQGVALSLILHELATNAVKHGALSRPGAELAIEWLKGERPSELTLSWSETSLHAAPLFNSNGFGMRLIQRSVTSDLHGNASRDAGTDYLKWTFEFPIEVSEERSVCEGSGVAERGPVLS